MYNYLYENQTLPIMKIFNYFKDDNVPGTVFKYVFIIINLIL